MRCEACGHENPKQSRFCVQCGRLLDASWLTPTPESAPRTTANKGRWSHAGEQWGHYTLLELLGEGEMGRVYRAQRQTDGQEFALKMLPPLREGDQAARRLLRREGEILSHLIHPSIVRFDEFLEEEGRVALVMELLRGPTLQAKLQEGPIAPDIALSLILEILEALLCAHQQGVVHRDLKPSNLFLVEAREHKAHEPILRVKIGGFGVARMRFEQLSTTLGQHIGESVTAQYMAPEQLQDPSAVDARSDLYALGVIAYEMLAGERMVNGLSHLTVIQQILHEPPPPLAQSLLDRLPSGFEVWHQTLLAKHPNDRFPTTETARDALLSLLHEPPHTRSTSNPSNPRSSASNPSNPRSSASNPSNPHSSASNPSNPRSSASNPSNPHSSASTPSSRKPRDPFAEDRPSPNDALDLDRPSEASAFSPFSPMFEATAFSPFSPMFEATAFPKQADSPGTADFDRDALKQDLLRAAHPPLSAPPALHDASNHRSEAVFAGAAHPSPTLPHPPFPTGTPIGLARPQVPRSAPTTPVQGTSDFDRDAYLAYQKAILQASPHEVAPAPAPPPHHASSTTASTPIPPSLSPPPAASVEDTQSPETFATLPDDDLRVAGFRADILAGVHPTHRRSLASSQELAQSAHLLPAQSIHSSGLLPKNDSLDHDSPETTAPSPRTWRKWGLLLFLLASGLGLGWGFYSGFAQQTIARWTSLDPARLSPPSPSAHKPADLPPTHKPKQRKRKPKPKRKNKRKQRTQAPTLRTQAPTSRAQTPSVVPPTQPLRLPPDLKAMRRVPKGWFPFGGLGSPVPIQWRRLPTFWIDRYEVTWRDYAACVAADACQHLEASEKTGFSKPTQPVVAVTWEEAATYCRFRNKRLPSSLEWEKAARGFEGQIFPFSGTSPDCSRAVFGRPKHRKRFCPTHPRTSLPVGSKPLDRSPFGVFDLAGNVREWTRDCASEIAHGNCSHREARGGSWNSQPAELLAARRWAFPASSRRLDLGFRCVWP
jgi:serine/threonine protein kinase/formylglycine-generating enzyme required for sulfatase activity